MSEQIMKRETEKERVRKKARREKHNGLNRYIISLSRKSATEYKQMMKLCASFWRQGKFVGESTQPSQTIQKTNNDDELNEKKMKQDEP